MAVEEPEKPCTVVLHDDRVSYVDVLAGTRVMHVGEVAWLSAPGARLLCICPAGPATTSNEISIHVSLAQKFGFENRTPGRIRMIDDTEAATATHVELFFRDQYLNSADMWQLMKCVQHTVVYKGQTMKYLGSTTAEVKNIWIAGTEVDSAFCSHPETKAIFRSGSARFTLLIEVSREMLEGWSQGELMYERLIYGFLWDLFHRWDRAKVKHLVTVVLFGRSLVAPGEQKRISAGDKQNDDFFYVLASEVPSASWTDIIKKLKRTFNDLTLSRGVSLASASNMLEAIHLTAMDYADFYTDAHVMSTGSSIVAVTAGTGLFEANHELLKQTTDLLVGNSIGVDIVALSPKPLHPVPLFRYDHEGVVEFALPHWVDISFWRSPNDEPQSTWTLPDTEEPVHDIAMPFMRESGFNELESSTMDFHDNQIFNDEPTKKVTARVARSSPPTDSVGSAETVKVRLSSSNDSRMTPEPKRSEPVNIPITDSSPGPTKEPLSRARRERLQTHPLMQTGRKISVGPKGLAISRGAASTTVSAEHARQEKDLTFGTSVASNPNSGGLAKAIRASLARKPSQQSLVSQRISEPDDGQTSRPINIHNMQGGKSAKSTQSVQSSYDDKSDLASIIEQGIEDTLVTKTLPQRHDTSVSATPKAGANFGSLSKKRDSTHESLDMLSPWVMLLNPCNPTRDNMRVASQYRKWQHVFPRAVSTGTFKWSGMCTPAELPLTAEYKPSGTELDVYYRKNVKLHNISSSSGLREESANILVERLIDVRLVRGFQIVAIRNESLESTDHKEHPVLLSLGRHYHQIQRFSDFQVQIVQYEPKAGVGSEEQETQHYLTSYEPKMRLSTGAVVRPEVTYHSEAPIADWTALDEHILGLAPMPEINAKFRVRLVLIPSDVHKGDNISRLGGLSDEERRIEGIQRLTQMWQRQRYFSSEDQSHQVSMKKAASTPYTAERDPNPLAIEYYTRDTSVVVNAQGPTLLSQLEDGEIGIPLFSEAEKHHSSNFDMNKLVRQMQEPPPNGVEARDRRWLTLTHLKCFRGDEMTTWLLGAFKDLELREDAVAVGNELMSRGVFSHVRQKHKFRDGNYFYQISSAYRTTEYPDTQGLFSKAPWRSIPPTPIAESIKSPVVRPVSGISTSNSSSSSDKGTPGLYPSEQKQIVLSQMMHFNADPQKKSNHLQIIDLHYDRIHNPENCYHIQLEWLGTSPKFIREALTRWSSLVEGYGLKLTQLPLDEAGRFREHHPFDQPQPVSLAAKPPDKVLATPLLEPHTFSPRMVEDRMAYHKRILRKLDFVLDYEAASTFTTSLDVMYSFGPPTYSHTQFVHKTGLVLAQIIANEVVGDVGDFLLLPNRLAASKLSTSSKHAEDKSAESVVKAFKAFCRDEEALRHFYAEVDKPKPPVAPSPLSNAFSLDSDVPSLSLPPHLSHRSQLRGI